MTDTIPTGLPSYHQLASAAYAARLLTEPQTKIVARAGYRYVPTDGRFTPEDMYQGESLLIECTALLIDGESLRPTSLLLQIADLEEDQAVRVLLGLYLQNVRPIWLLLATTGPYVTEELIPSNAAQVLSQAAPDPATRDAVLLMAVGGGGELKTELGARGEEFVISKWREGLQAAGRGQLVEQVRRVSLISNWLGYDVLAPALGGPACHVEVKTMGYRDSNAAFFLSRNEYEVGLRDPCWFLVLCAPSHDDELSIIGWCRVDAIRGLVPSDPAESEWGRARWMTVRIVLPVTSFRPGLPLAVSMET